MSQTTEAQTTQPTSEEVIGKVNESIAALQEAQKTVVEGAKLLAAHVNDPTAHGAAILEVVEQQLPIPVMEGTSLKWEKKDGTIIAGPVDLKGAPGQDGADGDTGPRPEHRWEGTKLLVQNSDGSWPAEGVDLKGEKGDTGQVEGLSDAVDSNSSTTPASSKAVKTAYDKAVTAQSAADAANSKAQEAWNAAETAQSAAQAAQAAAENIGIFSGSTPGLVPASDGDATKVLLGNGTWGSAVSADDGAAVMIISEDLHLTADSPRSLVLTATTSGLSVYLPDHATLQRGTTFHIWVRPLENIQLKDFSGETVKAYPLLAMSSAYLFQLVDETRGLWALAKYESGSTSDAQGKLGLNIGEMVIFSSNLTAYINPVVASLSDSKAILCTSEILDGTSHGVARVLNISDTTISIGEEKIFYSGSIEYISVATLSENKAIACYTTTSNSQYKCLSNILSISDAEISVGEETTVNLDTPECDNIFVSALSETKAIVRYDDAEYDKEILRILNISDMMISVGEVNKLSRITYTGDTRFSVLSEEKVIEYYGKDVRLLNVSGTTVSVVSNKIIDVNAKESSISVLSDSKAIIFYSTSEKIGNVTNYYGAACVLNVQDTTISSGTITRIISNSDTCSSFISSVDLSGSMALLCYTNPNEANYGKVCLTSIEGSTVIVNDENVFNYNHTESISLSRYKGSSVFLAITSPSQSTGMIGFFRIK